MSKDLMILRKKILITGASSGIGEEFARQFALQKCHLVLVARREDRLLKLKEELQLKGAEVTVIAADLSKESEPLRVFLEAIKSGPLHGLVNNAGLGHYGPFADFTLAQQLQMVDLNVRVVVELAHHAVLHMKGHGEESFILNVASVAGFQALENYAVYSASKSFVRAFSETLFRELKKSNILVTCLSPGGTYTEFLDLAGQELNAHANKMMMKTSDVVFLAIAGLKAQRAQVIPGKMNQLAAFLPRLLPYQTALHLFSSAMESAVTRKKK